MAQTNPSFEIRTDRLILRPPRADDATRIAALLADRDMVGMMSGPPWPYGLEDAQSFVAAAQNKDPARERPLAIEHPDLGLIGGTGFHRPPEHPLPELGYWLARDHWGQGYATEAVQAALLWAHRDWGKRAVIAGHFAENPASGRVLIKCGFLYTGEVKTGTSPARDEPARVRMMVWLA